MPEAEFHVHRRCTVSLPFSMVSRHRKSIIIQQSVHCHRCSRTHTPNWSVCQWQHTAWRHSAWLLPGQFPDWQSLPERACSAGEPPHWQACFPPAGAACLGRSCLSFGGLGFCLGSAFDSTLILLVLPDMVRFTTEDASCEAVSKQSLLF